MAGDTDFINRHNIAYAKISAESRSTNLIKADEWIKNVWPELRRHHKNEDIYSSDKAGIFYNLRPEKTFKFKGDTFVGGTKSKCLRKYNRN